MVVQTSTPTPIHLSPTLKSGEAGYELSIRRAILLQTVAYADLFDFPLTVDEIDRYLIGVSAPPGLVHQSLDELLLSGQYLVHQKSYVALSDRGALFKLREFKEEIAANHWKKARKYGRYMTGFPFVRMVAVTGALAVNNVTDESDLDFLMVTRAGRLWICRAMVVLLVRWAARNGDTVCPNLFLSENALSYPVQDIYTAHEMVQMVPLAGYNLYLRMMRMNAWTLKYLPNATILPADLREPQPPRTFQLVSKAAEALLGLPALDGLESWEMKRKLIKFNSNQEAPAEADFSPDWCKGFLNSHQQTTLRAYQERLFAYQDM